MEPSNTSHEGIAECHIPAQIARKESEIIEIPKLFYLSLPTATCNLYSCGKYLCNFSSKVEEQIYWMPEANCLMCNDTMMEHKRQPCCTSNAE